MKIIIASLLIFLTGCTSSFSPWEPTAKKAEQFKSSRAISLDPKEIIFSFNYLKSKEKRLQELDALKNIALKNNLDLSDDLKDFRIRRVYDSGNAIYSAIFSYSIIYNESKLQVKLICPDAYDYTFVNTNISYSESSEKFEKLLINSCSFK